MSIGKLFFPFLVELESAGAELNLYADRKVSDEERRGASQGILEAQVRRHTSTLGMQWIFQARQEGTPQ